MIYFYRGMREARPGVCVVRQVRSSNTRSGWSRFLIFVVVVLFADFVAGFVSGFISDSPRQTPAVGSGGETDNDPLRGLRETQGHVTGIGKTVPVRPADEGRAVEESPQTDVGTTDTAEEDAEDFRRQLEKLLEMEEFADIAAVQEGSGDRGDKEPAEQPEHGNGTAGDHEGEQPSEDGGDDVVVVSNEGEGEDPEAAHPERDPERDLYTFEETQVEEPVERSEEVRKADGYLEQGKKLLAKWNKTRARRDIIQAKEALLKATAYYRKAAESSPGDPYIERNLKLANQLHYLAMKSSPF
jgi:hypothetical protein